MTKKDEPKGKVDFSPPDAGEYHKRIAAAKSGRVPVGGAEMPTMPRLDQAPVKNRHDGVQGGVKAMSQDAYVEAIASGQAIPGVGGAYVANQPKGFVPPTGSPAVPKMEMSSKDGSPVNPPRRDGGLRPETQEALTAVAQANASGEPATDSNQASGVSKEDEDFLTKLGDATTDILRNKERRELIESRIEDELNFDDLLFNQELRQRVPIKKGFVPTFRTPAAAEDLFVKRLMGKEDGSPQYIVDKFAAMGLTCGLFAINGTPLPSHCDDSGVPQENLFEIKFQKIMKYPLIILADLSANFLWFEERVRKLLSLDAIKNF